MNYLGQFLPKEKGGSLQEEIKDENPLTLIEKGRKGRLRTPEERYWLTLGCKMNKEKGCEEKVAEPIKTDLHDSNIPWELFVQTRNLENEFMRKFEMPTPENFELARICIDLYKDVLVSRNKKASEILDKGYGEKAKIKGPIIINTNPKQPQRWDVEFSAIDLEDENTKRGEGVRYTISRVKKDDLEDYQTNFPEFLVIKNDEGYFLKGKIDSIKKEELEEAKECFSIRENFYP